MKLKMEYSIKKQEQIFQYYRIINDSKTEGHKDKNSHKELVYLQLDDTADAANDETTEDLLVPEANVQLNNSSSPSNVEIITLDDGRMFMTTLSEEESCESIEPHSISNSNNNEECNVVQPSENSDDNSSEYEIVQLVDNPLQIYQMIYCHFDSVDQEDCKKGKSFICLHEGCGKMYAVLHHLIVHMRTHLDTKPYICTIDGCEKTFSTNYSLKAHTRTHTGEKPYSCTMCQKSFKTSGDLQKHFRIHTGEKPFLCPIEGCGKSFTTSNIRKVHIRSHTGERPYTCDYPNCGKAFSSSTNYKNHIRIHSGEKPYICRIKECGKRFTEYSSLYKHNLVHRPDRPYACVYCGQKFKHEHGMNLHKKVKHNVILTSDGTEIVLDLN